MTPQAILQVIRQEGILEIEEDFSTTESLFDAGLDSMALMQLLLALESAFGKTVSPESISQERFETAESLAQFLNSTHD